MSEKYVGYSLLATGILLMIFAVSQIILVFTGKARPVEVFKMEITQQAPVKQEPVDEAVLLRQLETGNIQALMGSSMGDGLSGFGIDSAAINKMLNLTVYYLIMQVVLSLGYKLSNLGIQMLRPLNVTVQRNKIASMIDSEKTDQ